MQADVTDTEQIDAAFKLVEEHQGPVEVLVSNAGLTDDTLLMRMSDEQFERVINANLTGAYRVAKRASRGMLRGKWGRFVFISSVVGLSGSAGQANYAASRPAWSGFARSLARELGSRNITSNVIAPGFVRHRHDRRAARGRARSRSSRRCPPAGTPSRRRSPPRCATWPRTTPATSTARCCRSTAASASATDSSFLFPNQDLEDPCPDCSKASAC